MIEEEIKQRNESKEFLKDLQYYLFQNKRSPKIDKLSVLLDNDEKRIVDLEKENAELKADNDARKFAMAMSEKVEKQLREENAKLKDEWQEQVQKATDEGYARTLQTIQLSKATEIIKKYLAIGVGGKITQNYLDVTKEAEQFLKETK